MRTQTLLAVAAIVLAGCGGGSPEEPDGQALAPMDAEIASADAAATSVMPSAPGATQVVFAGRVFHVRSGAGGPGPNAWSAQNVWVDAQGALHLKIANVNGQWSCAEVYTNEALGFGTYQFKVAGHPELLDPNVVLGIFNYPTPDIGPDGTNEIDIEFATWGGVQAQHGNWTVWPAVAGPSQATHAFDPQAVRGVGTHKFNWTSRSVQFQSLTGNRAYANWTFAPADYLHQVPQHAMPLHINFWLFQGHAPMDGKDAEIVISAFNFAPAKRR